jgi:hypothetical protein
MEINYEMTWDSYSKLTKKPLLFEWFALENASRGEGFAGPVLYECMVGFATLIKNLLDTKVGGTKPFRVQIH